jgi:zinc transport system substrate-binding protein
MVCRAVGLALCVVAIGWAVLGVVAGCDRSPPPSTPQPHRKPVIYTTFYPTTYFVQRTVGEDATVVCPIPDGEDPSLWQPTPDVIRQYQGADLIVINGADFEKWLAAAALPLSRVVDSSASFRSEFVTFEKTTHSHGNQGTHTHEGIDGHTWMAPTNAIRQADAIKNSLVRRWPEHAARWEARFLSLRKDLEELDARLARISRQGSGALILASHPAYDYIAQRYALAIQNVHIEPDAPLDDSALSDIRARLANAPANSPRIMLWEEDPLPTTRDRLERELGIRSVTFQPCEVRSAEEQAANADYLSIMHRNLDRLSSALERR